jgi:uncharacterized protein (DUF1800 family)
MRRANLNGCCRLAVPTALAAALLAAACGGGGGGGGGGTAGGERSDYIAPGISTSTRAYAQSIDNRHYALSRFLEHATFGPTPAELARLRSMGIDGWLDEQFSLPAPRIDTEPVRALPDMDPLNWRYTPNEFMKLAVGAPQQLRLRTAWALSQLLVVSQRRVSGHASGQYFNMLLDRSFGNYGDLLHAVTVHATMGHFLDNSQNQRMGAFPGATANENYARELMQLFTIGLVELNPDGTNRLDSKGQPIATYGQREVEELARALTGWHFDNQDARRPNVDFANFTQPMHDRFNTHDSGSKRLVGGRVIAAGGNSRSDLDAVIRILMEHPNTAPFVSHKLIQHFVSGDPSPAYVARVATVFRQTNGELGPVVRAILTDPDARRGDTFGTASPLRGKMKEPVLVATQVVRAFGCATYPVDSEGEGLWIPQQQPFGADNVFNFYPPHHRVPGTNLVAPEHRLVNAQTLKARVGEWSYRAKRRDGGAAWRAAGCDLDGWERAADSAGAAVALISDRMFRGAMPENVRDAIVVGVLNRPWNPEDRIYDAVGLASISPAFGVIK